LGHYADKKQEYVLFLGLLFAINFAVLVAEMKEH
jgi:hypothetical protein